MDFADPVQRRAFFELHKDLPREGPGNRASTARALDLAQPLPAAPRILDIACGPGAQTLDLAALLPEAHIVAVDAHPGYLAELRRRAASVGAADRIETRVADMARLPFEDGAFDLLWCEGAAYIVGLPYALEHWARLVTASGRLALTEPVFLTPDLPDDVVDNWREYPGMANVAACREIIRGARWRLLGDFTLPESAWWDDYYGPLAARTERLSADLESEPGARVVLDEARREIDVYRRHSRCFGYQFFVMAR